MSGFGTHMLIGGVAGLALLRFAPGAVPPAAHQLVGGDLAVIALSAMLATWPDIDEPGSWISQQVAAVCSLLGVGLGLWVGFSRPPRQLPLSWTAWFVAVLLVGMFAGALIGLLIPQVIRRAAGGHRQLTHSVLVGAILVLAGALLLWLGFASLVIVPTALAWGLAWHVVGDLVTPAGVPLLVPFSDQRVRVLPRPLARFGEPIIALLALVAAWLLIWG